MKLPGKSRGGRRTRSVDPLGDPLADLDMDVGPEDTPSPVLSQPGMPEPREIPLDPVADLEPPTGIVSRLFGSDDGLDPRRDDDDFEDGAPGRRPSGRTALIAGVAALALVGAGYAAWQVLPGDGGDDATPIAGLPIAGLDGTVPVLDVPGADMPGVDINNPQVVGDATSATDRSPDRRPWLNAGEADGGGPTEPGHEDPAHDTPPHGEMAASDPGHDAPAHGEMGTADPGHEAPGHEDPAAADPGHEAPAHGDMAAADPSHGDPAHGDPAHEDPAHGDPTHGDMGAADPGHDNAGHETPDHGEMAAADPGHEDPGHEDMAAVEPGHEAPGHEDPGHADPAHQDPAQGEMAVAGLGGDGVRHRVDMAVPQIDLPDVPGLLPVPDGIDLTSEPSVPVRMGAVPPVPSYNALVVTRDVAVRPLSDAPIAALQENGPHGPVPAIGPDGLEPWRAYAAPDPAPPDRPRVAIIVYGLGMMADPLQAAITKLPPTVTLSFSPYAPDLMDKMAVARAAGHELLLDLPMEPDNFPARDPGPMGLLTLLPKPDNRDRLDQVLASGRGYVGVMAGSDGRFASSPEHMETVLQRLRRAGLVYLHRGDQTSLVANLRVLPPVTAVDVEVDDVGFEASLKARLDFLRRVALARGTAVGIMRATPLNFATLQGWLDELEASGVSLAPLSAVIIHAGGAGETAAMGGEDGGRAAPGDTGHTEEHAGDGHG